MAQMRIEKENWIPSLYGSIIDELPLTRNPVANFHSLSEQEKDRQMQIYATRGEILKILAEYETFYLTMKRDGVIGWIEQKFVKKELEIKAFPKLVSKLQSPLSFFKEWLATPYRWGGVSKAGIDCSAFTQLYFFEVLNMEIPKNSQDQRKLGATIAISDIQDEDLVFCHRKGFPNINHVGVYFQGNVHHAQLHRGVVCDKLDAFIERHVIQEIKRIS